MCIKNADGQVDQVHEETPVQREFDDAAVFNHVSSSADCVCISGAASVTQHFGDLPDLQDKVDDGNLIHLEGDTAAYLLLESGHFRRKDISLGLRAERCIGPPCR